MLPIAQHAQSVARQMISGLGPRPRKSAGPLVGQHQDIKVRVDLKRGGYGEIYAQQFDGRLIARDHVARAVLEAVASVVKKGFLIRADMHLKRCFTTGDFAFFYPRSGGTQVALV